jgi:hypothetical protein
VVLAAYFDESAVGTAKHGTVSVAASIATLENWRRFENIWRPVLKSAGRETSFHAVARSKEQQALNAVLPLIARECRVWTQCVTFDRADYFNNTSAVDRSQLGNDHGFAWFACASVIAEYLRDYVKQDAGYYIDQGGLGSDKAMQILGWVYRDPEWRESWRLADFGPADRRVQLPLHPADLVAHQVATNRSESDILSTFGDWLNVSDAPASSIREAVSDFHDLVAIAKRQHEKKRLVKRAARKQRIH